MIINKLSFDELLKAGFDELSKVHNQELNPTVAHNPNYAQYLKMDELGILHCWGAFDGGVLVGYVIFFVMPHLHHQHLINAHEDLYFLRTDKRQGWNGYKLLKTAIDEMSELADNIFLTIPRPSYQHLFERLGFRPYEQVFVKSDVI